MSILDEIRAEIGEAFSDPELFFSPAVLTRTTGGGEWIEAASVATTFPCLAMIDTYSDHLRAVRDIPDTHVKLMIVGTSISVTPLKGDSVTLDGAIWRVFGPVQTDPARAMWTAEASPA